MSCFGSDFSPDPYARHALSSDHAGSKKEARLTIRLTRSKKQALVDFCDRRRISVAHLIETFIDANLEDFRKAPRI